MPSKSISALFEFSSGDQGPFIWSYLIQINGAAVSNIEVILNNWQPIIWVKELEKYDPKNFTWWMFGFVLWKIEATLHKQLLKCAATQNDATLKFIIYLH